MKNSHKKLPVWCAKVITWPEQAFSEATRYFKRFFPPTSMWIHKIQPQLPHTLHTLLPTSFSLLCTMTTKKEHKKDKFGNYVTVEIENEKFKVPWDKHSIWEFTFLFHLCFHILLILDVVNTHISTRWYIHTFNIV